MHYEIVETRSGWELYIVEKGNMWEVAHVKTYGLSYIENLMYKADVDWIRRFRNGDYTRAFRDKETGRRRPIEYCGVCGEQITAEPDCCACCREPVNNGTS